MPEMPRVSVATLALGVCMLSGCMTFGQHAVSSPRPLSVQGALTLCRQHHAPARPVTVIGYFRLGPEYNGPNFIGGLFERNTVPRSAFRDLATLLRYHGLGFWVEDTSRLARSPVLYKIRDYNRLSVTGRLTCEGCTGIRPTAIRIDSTG